MNTGTISRRYAEALFRLAEQSGRGERDCAQALEILARPERKVEKLETDLQALVELLVKNGRLPYVKFILRNFVSMWRKSRGIVDVRLTTATALPELEDKLKRTLAEKCPGRIEFETRIDPEIIGGFTLVVDEDMLDASVRSKLDKVNRALEEMNKRIV